jgi:hypothetical protein
MGLKDRVVEGLRGVLWPDLRQKESGEAAALRQMYDGSNAVNMSRGRWYGLHSPGTGVRTGVRWVCVCGTSHDLLEAEKFRDYTCGTCKRPFDFAGWTGLRLSKNKQDRAAQLHQLSGVVLESDYIVGPTGDWLTPDKHESVLRQALRALPSRARENSGPRMFSTWDDSAGDVEYQQHDPSAGSNWR